MMLCDVPLHPRTRSTKGPDCPNDIQKRLRSPRQHLDDRQHSINPLPKRPAIDQRTEFVRLVRIHELFRLTHRFAHRRMRALAFGNPSSSLGGSKAGITLVWPRGISPFF